MKRLALLAALVGCLPSTPSLAAVCDASAFSIQSCFPSLSAPVLAWPGNIGLPKVIAWASTTGDSGVTWGTSASVTNGQAYLTYNGTEMVRNVPTGKGMAFAINGTIVAELASQGASQLQLASPNFFVTTTSTLDLDTSTNGSQVTDITEGNNVIRLFGTAFATAASQNTALYLTSAADAATVVAHFFRNSASLTATSKALADFQNGSQDEVLIRPTSGIALTNTVTPAAADVGIGNDGSNDLILSSPSGKNVVVEPNGAQDQWDFLGASGNLRAHISGAKLTDVANNAVITFTSGASTVTPGAGLSGAGNISWTSGPITSSVSWVAFTAGVDQISSAISVTGAAFGDSCTVGTPSDVTASIGGMSCFVTSAGNVKISIAPISTTSTANPGTLTMTVRLFR